MALEQFHTFYQSLNNTRPPATWRDEAYRAFSKRGLPTRKQESWRYAQVPHWYQHFYSAPDQHVARTKQQAVTYDADIVFEDGIVHWVKPQAGLRCVNLAQAPNEEIQAHVDALLETNHTANSFVDFTLACLSDGVFVEVAPGVEIKQLKVLHRYTKKHTSHTLQSIKVCQGARVHIQERFISTNTAVFQQHHVARIILEDNTLCTHDTIHEQAGQGVAQVYRLVEQYASSQYHASHYHFNCAAVRDESVILLKAPRASCTVVGMSAVADTNWQSTHVRVMHLAHHCESTQLFRTLVANAAQQSFQGEIFVPKGVQGTIAHQDSKSILLSDKARSNVKPFLEIYTDDVVCSHSATVGQLDPEAVFYMRTRGLTEAQACSALLYAFVDQIVRAAHSVEFTQKIDEKMHMFCASLAKPVEAK